VGEDRAGDALTFAFAARAVMPAPRCCGILPRMTITPRPLRALAALLLIGLLLAACAHAPRQAAAPALPDPVILISLDGFHPDYLQRGLSPTLQRLADTGVLAAWMNPSYPSLTFPNHYTLVTGLRPDRHGIVHNTMFDPALGSFGLSLRGAVEDGRWWGGEPIWVTARRQGLRTATMFWPGSEAEIAGLRPHEWFRFSPQPTPAERVDTLLAWLDRPEPDWPRFMTLYFEHVDTAGHDFGPHAPQTDAAIAAVDAALARLLDGLRARGLEGRVNLIITSDHGMAEVSSERVILLDDHLPREAARILTLGEVVGLSPQPGHEAEVEAALLGRHAHFACWRREQLPPRWHYGRHPRIPAIVCQADEGWKLLTRAALERAGGRVKPGAHGFDPEAPSMRALFLAHGPAFAQGVELPPFDNVHVYPLLAHLLGITAADCDGDLAVLVPALRSAHGTQAVLPGQSCSSCGSTRR
jgi:predicted AlkP superfamily pyrophosphatase or phosphodiesterase